MRLHVGVAALALRRLLHPGVVATTVALALVLARATPGTLVPDVIDDSGGVLARGWARAGMWLGLSSWILGAVAFLAARTVPRWRAGEADWLGSRAVGRGTVVLSTWSGQAVAALLLVASAAIAAELAAGGSAPSWRFERAVAGPAEPWIEAGQPLGWRLPPTRRSDAEAVRRTSFDLRVARGGPGVSVGAAAVRLAAGRTWDQLAPTDLPPLVERRVVGRTTVELDVPGHGLPGGPGDGPGGVVVELRPDPGEPAGRTGVVFVPGSGELWSACPSDRTASASLALRVALLAAAWAALAFGLGGWLGAPIVAGLLLAGWLPAWLGAAPPSWLPAADLPEALAIVGRGRVPAPTPSASWLGAVVCVAIGLGLAVWSAKPWRREP